MIPYFLSAGVHLERDLTEARNKLSCRYPGVDFRLSTPLGPHELLDQLVAIRAREVEALSVRPDPPRLLGTLNVDSID